MGQDPFSQSFWRGREFNERCSGWFQPLPGRRALRSWPASPY
ncbi:hypothetical protein BF49_4124 [Bradyrhizobium sp.]|nr:hypothetical protein BF49_4124 [Bradyrhizobium sp.]